MLTPSFFSGIIYLITAFIIVQELLLGNEEDFL